MNLGLIDSMVAEMKRKMDEPLPPESHYWPLFKHMSDEHGLTLTDSEMDDICQVVYRVKGIPPLFLSVTCFEALLKTRRLLGQLCPNDFR